MTVEVALRTKGLTYERVVLQAGPHGDGMEDHGHVPPGAFPAGRVPER